MRPRLVRLLTALAACAVLLVAAVAAVAAGGASDPPGLERALAVHDRHAERLLARDDVVGSAVGLDARGNANVQVYVSGERKRGIPERVDGVPVEVRTTGDLRAVHHRPGHGGGSPGSGGGGGGDSTLKPTDRWPRPVPIGISTGNEGECSAGTIGARVRDANGAVYALSNNHVYALENEAEIGSNVLQPGRFDTNCAVDPNDVLGQLSDFEPLRFTQGSTNTIDAAIAVSSTAALGSSTPPDGYGTPQSGVVSASLGHAVQKYGRTTALTSGTITGIAATLEVGYSSGTATFVDQIIVEGRKPFLKSGDSGSLVVTSSASNPVGLAFAADNSGKFAVANRIDLVLQRFGVSIDGL